MRTPPEFFQGSITDEFCATDFSLEAASLELAAEKKAPAPSGKTCTPPKVCPAPSGKTCTPPKVCPAPSGKTCTPPLACKPEKKGAAAFLPSVEGWSVPPAPSPF